MERFKDCRDNAHALREAVDAIFTGLVLPKCEHLSDPEWTEMEEEGYEIIRDLVLYVQKNRAK